MTATLVFKHVDKSFGDTRVLHDISFSVDSGETVGLLGLNGAGKTTLIRGLLDLNRVDSGEIEICGVSNLKTVARAGVCYLAERFQPPAFATGYELVRHMLALSGHPFSPSELEREADLLELEREALARPVREYSKGMAQKIGLIACVLPQVPLLVLDEPMSGLDPKARSLFKRRLGQLGEAGTALFFSTHLLADVESLCDRILIIHSGRLLFDGQVESLLSSTGLSSLEQAFLATIEQNR